MEPSAVDALLCPVCGLEFMEPLPGEAALKCIDGHSFDIARQGYVNLLTGHGTKYSQDTAEMVAARDAFLDAGHYRPLGKALAAIVGRALAASASHFPGTPPLLLDAGTGTGWYLQQVRESIPVQGADSFAAVGLDISKFALRRAARRNPEAANLVWDLWQPLPVEAGRVDAVLVIFAPRNASEFARVLRPEGRLVVVTPRSGHLAEIAREAGMLGIQPEKEANLAESLAGHFALESATPVTIPLQLAPADVRNVALMGPAGHHRAARELAHTLSGLPESTLATAEFTVSVFRPHS
jgi:23S rRNA (guanine745-N1)-methyltransferase